MLSDTPNELPPEEAQSEEFWTWFETRKERRRSRKSGQPATTGTATVRRTRRRIPGSAITGSGRRRPPNTEQRTEILNRQRNRCLYCDNQFGSVVRRGSIKVTLQLHWDHFVPYAYGQTNAGTNWVAACHVCNGIKSARMFDTVAEAQAYIRERWAAKGYELGVFPLDAPKPASPTKSIDPNLVPLELAQLAEDVSRDLEENSFPVAVSAIAIPGVGQDKIRDAVLALFAGGYVSRASSVGATRYSSAHAYRAPAGAPITATKPIKRKPLHPSAVTCPTCGERPPGRCFGARRTVLTAYHPERIKLAKESS